MSSGKGTYVERNVTRGVVLRVSNLQADVDDEVGSKQSVFQNRTMDVIPPSTSPLFYGLVLVSGGSLGFSLRYISSSNLTTKSLYT